MADHWRSPRHDNVIELAAARPPAAPHRFAQYTGKDDCAPIADGSSPSIPPFRQQTTRQFLADTPVPKDCRGFSDSGVRDLAALIFAAIVFGIPGIGATILLVGYLIFFA